MGADRIVAAGAAIFKTFLDDGKARLVSALDAFQQVIAFIGVGLVFDVERVQRRSDLAAVDNLTRLENGVQTKWS